MMSILMTAAVATAAIQCPGNGFVETDRPAKAEPTGKEWVERINKGTEGFAATVTLDDGKPLRITPPRRIIDFPGYVPFVTRSDDGDTITAVKVMGMRKVDLEYNRLSGIMIITVPEGRWVGRCERQRK